MNRRGKIVIWISASVLAFFIVAITLTVLLFPGEKLRTTVERSATDALMMPVRIGGVGISFWSFPSFEVTGIAAGPARPGEAPLATVRSVRARIGFLPLLRGQVDIVSLTVDKPVVNMITRADGSTNLPATKKTPSQAAAQSSAVPQIPVPITLRSFRITDGAVTLINDKNNSRTVLEDISQKLSLRIDRNLKSIKSSGNLHVGNISLFSGGKRQPVSGVSLEFGHELTGNPTAGDYTLSKGELTVNGLPITVTGALKGGKNAAFHLDTGSMDAAKFISALPDSMIRNKKDISATGAFSLVLDGKADLGGPKPVIHYTGAMNLKDMSLAVKGLPKKVDAIRSTIAITDTTLNFSNTEVRIAQSKVTLAGMVSQYLAKPILALKTTGNIDMNDVTAALPLLKANELKGGTTFDLAINGPLAEKQNLQVNGGIGLRSLSLVVPKALKNPALVSGEMKITPGSISLPGLTVKTGKSDFTIIGNLTDYMSLLEKKMTKPIMLKGALSSNYIDLNDMLVIDKNRPLVKPWDLDEPLRNLPVPPTLKADLAAKLNAIVFGRLKADSAVGNLSFGNGKLELSKLNVAAYQGTLTGQTVLDFNDPKKTAYNGAFAVKSLNAQTFISSFFGIGQNFKGLLSSSFSFNGTGLDSLSFMKNLKADGAGQLDDGQIVNWDFLKAFGQQFKFLNFDTMNFGSILGSFTVDNGRVITPNLVAKTQYGDLTFAGSTGFDTSVSYDIAFKLNSAAMNLATKNKFGDLAGILSSSSEPEFYIVASGTLKSPTLKIDKARSGKAVKQQLKNKAEELLNTQPQDLQKKGKDLIRKIFK